MIRGDVFLEIGVCFHGHDVLDGGEDGLNVTVDLGDIGELWVENLGHQAAGGGGVVDLTIFSASSTPTRQYIQASYHSPPLRPIPRHQTPHHRTMHLHHILPILLFAQTFLPIPHDGQHEFLTRLLALQQFDVLPSAGFVSNTFIVGVAVAAEPIDILVLICRWNGRMGVQRLGGGRGGGEFQRLLERGGELGVAIGLVLEGLQAVLLVSGNAVGEWVAAGVVGRLEFHLVRCHFRASFSDRV